MKSSFSKLFRKENPSGKKTSRKYQAAATFLVCVLLAFFSWLLTVLEKEYDSRLAVPVVYENLPSGRMLANPLPSSLSVEVRASGFSLLSVHSGFRKSQVVLDMNSQAVSERDEKQGEIKMASAQFIPAIQSQLGPEIHLLAVFPDTLLLNFRPRSSKKVPVHLKAGISFAENCDYTGNPKMVPDSVTVFGSEEELRSCEFVDTKSIQFSKVDESFQKEIPLETGKNMYSRPASVRITVSVDKYAGQEVEVQVQPVHIPAGSKVKLIPSKVKISYLVSRKEYRKLSPGEFVVNADFADGEWKASGFIAPVISGFPKGIKNVKTIPPQIEYLLISQ